MRDKDNAQMALMWIRIRCVRQRNRCGYANCASVRYTKFYKWFQSWRTADGSRDPEQPSNSASYIYPSAYFSPASNPYPFHSHSDISRHTQQRSAGSIRHPNCVRNFLLSNANNIHTIKLLQIVKSMNSISDGTRAQLYPKRIGYVRRTFTKQIHLYSIGSAKWLEHFSLANWAIRKSAISFFAIFSLYFSSFRSSLGIFYCIFLVAFAEVDAR